MRNSLVSDAWRMAWFRRKPSKTQLLIFHRDRGSQYCSESYQTELKRFNIKPSMSWKGDCWDNAPTESLWGSLKVGGLHGRQFTTRREAMDEGKVSFIITADYTQHSMTWARCNLKHVGLLNNGKSQHNNHAMDSIKYGKVNWLDSSG